MLDKLDMDKLYIMISRRDVMEEWKLNRELSQNTESRDVFSSSI